MKRACLLDVREDSCKPRVNHEDAMLNFSHWVCRHIESAIYGVWMRRNLLAATGSVQSVRGYRDVRERLLFFLPLKSKM